jgi:hypothetical protein
VAVEGDWPDCFQVYEYLEGLSDNGQSSYKVFHSFNI